MTMMSLLSTMSTKPVAYMKHVVMVLVATMCTFLYTVNETLYVDVAYDVHAAYDVCVPYGFT